METNLVNVLRCLFRFLADADWDEVEKYIGIEDPYETTADEVVMGLPKGSRCCMIMCVCM